MAVARQYGRDKLVRHDRRDANRLSYKNKNALNEKVLLYFNQFVVVTAAIVL